MTRPSTSAGAPAARPRVCRTTTSPSAGCATRGSPVAPTASKSSPTTACACGWVTNWWWTSGATAGLSRSPWTVTSRLAPTGCGSSITNTPATPPSASAGAGWWAARPGAASTSTIVNWRARRRWCATMARLTSTGAAVAPTRPCPPTISQYAGRTRWASTPASIASSPAPTTACACGWTVGWWWIPGWIRNCPTPTPARCTWRTASTRSSSSTTSTEAGPVPTSGGSCGNPSPPGTASTSTTVTWSAGRRLSGTTPRSTSIGAWNRRWTGCQTTTSPSAGRARWTSHPATTASRCWPTTACDCGLTRGSS